MTLIPIKDRPELTAKIRAAMEAFNAMSPEEQRAHRVAQRKSWVVGEMMLEHPEMTRAEAEAVYEKVQP